LRAGSWTTGGARTPVSLGIALLAAGLVFLAFGFPAQSLALILIGTILGGAGFFFTNPVQMAALSETPLEQRGTLAGIFPVAGNFGTALWVALLTAGMGTLMSSCTANNAGATEAAAQASALGTLAWIGVAATLPTLFVALKLPKPASESPVPGTTSGSATAPGE
jgi:MFS family permease